MSETHAQRRIGRSIGAVLAGFLAAVILSLDTDMTLHVAHLLRGTIDNERRRYQ
jgi:hypothetical protein